MEAADDAELPSRRPAAGVVWLLLVGLAAAAAVAGLAAGLTAGAVVGLAGAVVGGAAAVVGLAPPDGAQALTRSANADAPAASKRKFRIG